jgi:hypothetical protein
MQRLIRVFGKSFGVDQLGRHFGVPSLEVDHCGRHRSMTQITMLWHANDFNAPINKVLPSKGAQRGLEFL